MDKVKKGDLVKIIKDGNQGKTYEVKSVENKPLGKIKLEGREEAFTIFDIMYVKPRKYSITVSHIMTTELDDIEARSIVEAEKKAKEIIEEEFRADMTSLKCGEIEASICYESLQFYCEVD